MGALELATGAAASGIAAGALSGMFGIGGGIVLVPFLGALLGLDQHRAQGVSLAVMLAPIGLPAVLEYRKAGHPVRWKLVGWLLLGFLAGVTAGALFANAVPNQPLRWTFIAFLTAMAFRYLWTSKAQVAESLEPERDWKIAAAMAIAVGAVGGLLSGLLGIGGGAVVIPLLGIWMKMPQHEAQLTSLALMLPPIGLPGVLVYAQGHSLPWLAVIFAGLGFSAGALMGARFAVGMKGPALQRGFAGLMLLLAVLLAFKA